MTLTSTPRRVPGGLAVEAGAPRTGAAARKQRDGLLKAAKAAMKESGYAKPRPDRPVKGARARTARLDAAGFLAFYRAAQAATDGRRDPQRAGVAYAGAEALLELPAELQGNAELWTSLLAVAGPAAGVEHLSAYDIGAFPKPELRSLPATRRVPALLRCDDRLDSTERYMGCGCSCELRTAFQWLLSGYTLVEGP